MEALHTGYHVLVSRHHDVGRYLHGLLDATGHGVHQQNGWHMGVAQHPGQHGRHVAYIFIYDKHLLLVIDISFLIILDRLHILV